MLNRYFVCVTAIAMLASAATHVEQTAAVAHDISAQLRISEPKATQGSAFSASAGLNFDGVGQGFAGPQGTFSVATVPPDTNGAAGDTQYVQIVKRSFAIFDKNSGNTIYGPASNNTLWQGFGGSCETVNGTDPIVLFDKQAHRWVFSQFTLSGPPYYECVAVSLTSDATGAYSRYAFPYSNTPDYPKMGVWPDAYYETFNMISSTGAYLGAQVCAYDRAHMLAGQPASQQCFQLSPSDFSLLPADLDGAVLPPTGAPNYLLSLPSSGSPADFDAAALPAARAPNSLSSPQSSGFLNLYKFHVDWTNPANSTLSGPTSLAVSPFGGVSGIPQPPGGEVLDDLSDRLMYRLAYRNFGDHDVLLTNHTVDAGGGVAGVRWYEIRNPGSTSPTIYQQSTFAPDSTFRWMGSAAMDASGNIALGYSVSSSVLYPGVRVTGRLASDPLNVLQPETSVIEGGGYQYGSDGRWGDYSSMSIDPVDDCTFWYTQQYIKQTASFAWNTRIATFKFPGCGNSAIALISNPTVYEYLPNNVTIAGTASGPTFASYQLEYGTGASPTTWVPIGGAQSQPVVNGTLGTWSTSTLAPGVYTLRLHVTTTDAKDFYQAVTPLYIDRTRPILSVNPSTLTLTAPPGAVPPAQTITLSNSGGGDSLWTASTNATWLSIAPSSGKVAAQNTESVSIAVTNSTLPAGTYTAPVFFTDQTNLPQTVSVTYTVVGTGISIVSQPTDQTAAVGQTATFSIIASAPSTLRYRWYKNYAAILDGGSSSTYTTPPVSSTDDGAVFTVIVLDAAGDAPITSNPATLHVTGSPPPAPPPSGAPTITQQPQNASVSVGQSAMFSVVASDATSYQWQSEAPGASSFSNISGATTASYTTPPTALSDSGTQFHCVISNPSGSVTSAIATLTVNSPTSTGIVIVTQPANQTVAVGQTATFSVVASATSALRYRWYKNGQPIFDNGSTSTYTTPPVAASDDGIAYSVSIGDAAGDPQVLSSPAILHVGSSPPPPPPPGGAPTIIQQPQNATVLVGQSATFAVMATGATSYQWQSKAPGSSSFSNISGAGSASYVTGATTLSANGTQFQCIVSNLSGSVTSAIATLSVATAPTQLTIQQQPTDATVTVGQSATFSVVATGPNPIRYRWYLNGKPLFQQANGSTYTTAPVTSADDGSQFYVGVNDGVTLLISNVVTLHVRSGSP